MILRSSPPSPFGRKIKIALALTNLPFTFQMADTMDEKDTMRVQNPLGKIPILIDNDKAIYDSRVILEYIDRKAGGGKIIPKSMDKRFDALTLQALADGILDACIIMRYEGVFRKPEEQNAAWLAHQQGKVDRAMHELEKNPPKWRGTPNVGIITVACVLGYLDLRFKGEWRKSYPKLVKWIADFEKRVPSFTATRATV